MIKKMIYIAFILIFIIYSSLLTGCRTGQKSKNCIHIAAGVPMTGSQASTGKSMVQAIQLYLKDINENGGINGNKIILDVYDDKGDHKLSKEKALEIIKDNRAVAVIGHNYSSSSISAGKIYKKYKIPAISSTSTNVAVTHENNWYFRVIFNDNLQGRFLANYANKIFHQKNVSIIREDLAYGSYLAQVFEKISKDIGTDVKYIWDFKMDDENLDSSLEKIVMELKAADNAGLIFLATHAPEGVKLIKMMKDNGIDNPLLCPDSFATEAFPKLFNQYRKEQLNPGYYSNGIYVTTPLIFDDADDKTNRFIEEYKSEYQEVPAWSSAFSYDAAMVICRAIKDTGLKGEKSEIADDREKIRNYLANLNSMENAVQGITGYNYFDENGDSPKPISIGVFKNSKIISAMIQLQDIIDTNEVSDLNQALEDGRVLLVDGRYLYKTNVVYTGIEINKIRDIDLHKLTCSLDFFVWFRFQGDIDTDNIKFLNTAEDFELEKPVEEYTGRQIKYRRYHVNTKFKMEAPLEYSIFGKYILPIRFRHNKLNRNNLTLVSDHLGMGLTGKECYIEKIDKNKVISSSSGWTIDNIRFFQNRKKVKAFGNPEIHTGRDGTIDYSGFNAEITIKKNKMTLRGMIPEVYVNYVFALSILILLLLKFLSEKWHIHVFIKWLIKAVFCVLLLLSGEFVIAALLSDKITAYIHIIRLFDILWWILYAYLAHCVWDILVWMPLEERTNQKIPNIIRNFTGFIIYTCAVSCIIAFVFDQKITSLLATSGVIAMIIGLAIQMNLSNIFSGIAINIEHPFRIGDWVKIGEMEGRVIDINWRTTRILKSGGSVQCIPNSVTSESVIRNFYMPEKQIRLYYSVHIEQEHPPEQVKKVLLDALLNTDKVLLDPPPAVNLKGFTEWSAEYGLDICMASYDDRWAVRNSVWDSIWTHLHKSDIRLAFQQF